MISTRSSLLLRLQSRGDEEAWEKFVRLYSPLITHWAKELVRDSNLAADLSQEIFVSLLQKIHTILARRPEKFRLWLKAVTLNRTRDWLRKEKKRISVELSDGIASKLKNHEELLCDREYSAMLAKSALEMMREYFSETSYQACWQSVVLERPVTEIAKELGITPNAVYLARARILARLRRELSGFWSEP